MKCVQVYMKDDEIDCVKSYLNKDNVMLEWGSGGSTVYFMQFVKEYHSVEHDGKWSLMVMDMAKKAYGDLKFNYVPQNKDRSEPTKREEFKDYIEVVHKINKKFDRVLIDGRARQWCAIEVLPYLTDDAVVFIHDFVDRERYFGVLDHYFIIEVVESLVVLKKK